MPKIDTLVEKSRLYFTISKSHQWILTGSSRLRNLHFFFQWKMTSIIVVSHSNGALNQVQSMLN